MQLKHPAPDFELPDLQGNLHKLSDYRGKIVIVNFWSAECPHSERTDRSTMACLVQWGEEVEMLSIAANRSESIQMVEEAAKTRRLPMVLIDAEQIVADLYEAQLQLHMSLSLTGKESCVIVARWMMSHSVNGKPPVSFWKRQSKRCWMGVARVD